MNKTDLWDAINHYCVACGGSPATRIYGNVERQRAVVAVEKAICETTENAMPGMLYRRPCGKHRCDWAGGWRPHFVRPTPELRGFEVRGTGVAGSGPSSAHSRALGALLDAQDEATRAEVLAALCHGITRAARLLGVPRRTLAHWVARHGLEHADGRTLPWPWSPGDANCQSGASNGGANLAKTPVDAPQKVQTLHGGGTAGDDSGQDGAANCA